MSKRLAFLGPSGTYSEEAALTYDPEATLMPFASIPAVGAAVQSGLADEGVVPIENSLEGSVTYTLDLLIREHTLFIRRELVLQIEHCLLGKQGIRAENVRVVYSHPQALAQCRSFLEKRLSNSEQVASLSVARAVEEMQASESVVAAAIANRRTAALYGATVLAENIEDSPNNETRFVALGMNDHPPTSSDKTSICFAFGDDAPGILNAVLGEFAARGINLAKIESRPTRQGLGRYIFLVDLEGHRGDRVVAEALDAVKGQVSSFRIFGSYPMHVSSAVR